MRKLRRILSLFLVSILVVGNVQAIPAEASNITKLEIKVKGEGEVVIDDGSSKYSLGNKDIFRADCTVDTNLRITATPNEGYFISSIEGIENDGVINGNSKIYDVNLKGVASGKCGFHTLRAFSPLTPMVCRLFRYSKVYIVP